MNSDSKLSFPAEIIYEIKETVDCDLLLSALGFSVFKATSNELRCPCRIHGGDNPTAFVLRTDLKRWQCYTHHCELSSGNKDNDLVALVMAVRRCSFVDAVTYLASLAGIDLGKPDSEDNKRKVLQLRRQRECNGFVKFASRVSGWSELTPTISEATVATYIRSRDSFFLDQGFQQETLEKFEIGSKYDSEGVKRATIPIRDHLGRLVSVSARREDGDDEPRYRLDYEFEKSKVVYNLDKALAADPKTLILVEGFKACWAVDEAGKYNVGAVMGSLVVDRQYLLLVQLGIENVVLMLDGDKAGRAGMTPSEKLLRRSMNVLPIYLPEGYSPDSYQRRDLSDLLDLYIGCF